MIITLDTHVTDEQRAELLMVLYRISNGTVPVVVTHAMQKERIVLDLKQVDTQLQTHIEQMAGVEKIQCVKTPYKLVSRAFKEESTSICIGAHSDCEEVVVGGDNPQPVIMAGPCAVESHEQLFMTARAVKRAGAHVLRGGAFKPRTSPYQFQGLGIEGLMMLAEARELTGLPVITEIMEPALVDAVAQYADILQIGARNVQNYALLKAVGQHAKRRPVLLKRGLSTTIEEWLLAAEYIVASGNPNVILCERGIRSYDQQTRNVLDLTSVALLKELTHLPVIVDPSHSTGRRSLVTPMSRASIAAGAAGLIIETHVCPDEALCDGKQSIYPEQLAHIVYEASWYTSLSNAKPQEVYMRA